MPTLQTPPVPPVGQSYLVMSDRMIRYEGQPVAIVLAETLEQAEEGAALVELDIEASHPKTFDSAATVSPRTESNGQSRVELGADAAGKLTAIVHETENVTSDFADYVEFGSAGSRSMYNSGAYRFRTRVRRADVETPTAMRAPMRRQACSPSKAQWTSLPMRSISIRWNSAFAIIRIRT